MKNGYWGWYPLDILVSIFHVASCIIMYSPYEKWLFGVSTMSRIHHLQVHMVHMSIVNKINHGEYLTMVMVE